METRMKWSVNKEITRRTEIVTKLKRTMHAAQSNGTSLLTRIAIHTVDYSFATTTTIITTITITITISIAFAVPI
jgi:hypothetical protein